MRILNISSGTKLNKFDALYTHTFSLVRQLSELGHKQLIIVRGKEDKVVVDENFKIIVLKFKSFSGHENFITILYYFIFNNIKLLLKIIKVRDYDVIYERHSPGYFIGLIFSKIRKVPLIYEVNGIVDEELFINFSVKNRLFTKIISKILSKQLNNSYGVIVQTKELKKIIKNKFGTKNIFIVPNGTNLQNVSSKRNLAKMQIVYVGELDVYHNLEDVFQATHHLNEDFVLHIVGEGSMRKKYEEKYGGDKRFMFTGELNHKSALEIIGKSDICLASYGLQCSLFKKYGFYFCPLKILEYLSFGKPIVLYGLSNSFIKKLESKGAIIVVRSKKQFVIVLKKLIKDKKKRTFMSNAAKRIAHKFTWQEAGMKTEGILKNVIKTNKE